MKLAVSNIAWLNEEEAEVAERLMELGVRYIEIAPTKIWQDPTKASAADIGKYIKFWKNYDIEIVAFQSMLFTRPDLKIFESEQNRQETLKYLQDFIGLAADMGAKRMVFGSPKNRQIHLLSIDDATKIAVEFFQEIGNTAAEKGVSFCIEPNPVQYGCDFITDAASGLELVRSLSNPGFGLHLDIAGMTLAGDDIAGSINNSRNLLKHFHISSPYLEQVDELSDVNHVAAAKALKSVGYEGFVSIEMKPGQIGANLGRVDRAVRFALKTY